MIPATQSATRTNAIDVNGGATETTAAKGSLLQEPAADPVTSLMMMMVKMHKEQRSERRVRKGFPEKAEAAADAERVHDMHEKADEAFTEGLVTGALDLGLAAMSCTSAVLTTTANTKELNQKELEANKALEKPDALETPAAKELEKTQSFAAAREVNSLKAWSSAASIAGQGITVGKDLAGGTFHMMEGNKDADAAAAEGASHRSASQADRARDLKNRGTRTFDSSSTGSRSSPRHGTTRTTRSRAAHDDVCV